jgi:hypothetical protein
MKKEFVPYELAVKLKALGFDEPCIATHGYLELYINTDDGHLKAPLFQQAFRWFREKHGLYSHVRESYSFDNTLEFVSQINGSYVNHGISDKPINRFDTYEEAELACLTKLIEIVELKSE